ncbi:MAG: hypothetical protein U1F77_10480 [Kiritimatiellia bacterium]
MNFPDEPTFLRPQSPAGDFVEFKSECTTPIHAKPRLFPRPHFIFYVAPDMRKTIRFVLIIALLPIYLFMGACVQVPRPAMSYSIGPAKYLSDHGARLLIAEFMNGSITNKSEALSMVGDVECQESDHGLLFNVISDKMADAYSSHYATVSRRFAMNCGVLIVELTDSGELDYMKLEYMSSYRRYHYKRN